MRVDLPAPFSPSRPMDLAGLHDEIDPIVGHDPGEALGDPPQLESFTRAGSVT